MSRNIMSLFVAPAVKNLLKPSMATQNINFQLAKNFSTKQLTPHVALMTNGSTKHLRSRPNLSEYSAEGRPLAVLLCWLAAKNNAVNKYAQFYTDQGFDVLTVRITPWQLLLPANADPIIREEILPTLLSSDHEKKLIHGFSVGGYVFAQMLKYMHNDPTGKCQDLMKTMTAQVWDSVVDVNGISIGVSKSVFMKSPFLQKSLQSYIDFHLKAFYDIATKYYDEAHDVFYEKPLHAPALFLASEVDPISTIDVIQDIQKIWHREFGIPCASKYWANTSHVGHMRKYPNEYKMTLKVWLDSTGFKRGPRMVRDETVIPTGTIPNAVYS